MPDINLKPFLDRDNLYTAARDLFTTDLQIPLKRITELPVPLERLLGGHFREKIHSEIDAAYFVGLVDDNAFESHETESPSGEHNDAVEVVRTQTAHKYYDGMSIFALDLKTRDNQRPPTRSALADITRSLNRAFHSTPVAVVFRYRTENTDYISLATCERTKYEQSWREGEKPGKFSVLRDINLEEPHAGHCRILSDLRISSTGRNAVSTFRALHKQWQCVFNSSVLTKEFYSDISHWFHWATQNVHLPNFAAYLAGRDDAEEENRRRFVLRLLCRTLFCWFLKERRLIAEELLDLWDSEGVLHLPVKDAFPKSNDYYRGILQNIFFNCLNTDMSKRRLPADRARFDSTVEDPEKKKLAYRGKNYWHEEFDHELLDSIPYLNGGLFDVLDEDNASDTIEDSQIAVPNFLFIAKPDDGYTFRIGRRDVPVQGLNYILSRYKFTIQESTPSEVDVALDPELLGLIFENLLAEINVDDEDASKSARKASGSYYTPRAVVEYMVNETLSLHLRHWLSRKGYADADVASIDELVFQGSFDPDHNPDLTNEIIQALDRVRILDPACGSGAFPMGALHCVVRLLQIVDPGNRRWLHSQLAQIDSSIRLKVEAELQKHNDDFSRKLGIIKNTIHGVDIQPLAVLITKLRFFISLLSDQQIDLEDMDNNYGLTPLPNLESKIICANTLAQAGAPDMFDDQAKKRYRAAVEEYYQPEISFERRDELVEEIATCLAELYPNFAEEATGIRYTDRATQRVQTLEFFKEWFRHSVLPAPFFCHETFFPELAGSGFDIVIGNPPYGGNPINETLKNELGLGSRDIYGAFISRFLRKQGMPTPLKPEGILSYIVSDTFMTIKTHLPLRKQMMDHRIQKMIRVGADTFGATVNTAVIVVQKDCGPGIKAPDDKVLAEAWTNGPLCLMADLTNISIHEQYDRFLAVLFGTGADARQHDVSTESCAVYHYPQALINISTSFPFFVGSPRLFMVMNDTTATTKTRYRGSKPLTTRTASINDKEVEVVKLGDLATVKTGLQTGDNDAYLYQTPEARGSYRSIEDVRQFLLTDEDIDQIRADGELRDTVIHSGIAKENRTAKNYFGGRYIVPYDKGGESDSEGGWLPNYNVPTDYFIDWSEEAVSCLLNDGRIRPTSGRPYPRNVESFFQSGITFSRTGFYAPTFRFNSSAAYDTEGCMLFVPDTVFLEDIIGFCASRFLKYQLKVFVGHTVHCQIDELKQAVLPVDSVVDIRTDVMSIAEKQDRDTRYDYASEEQLDIDKAVYDAYGLLRLDIFDVETWYARRYPKLVGIHRKRLRAKNKLPSLESHRFYCDESCHTAHGNEPWMVLGAVYCPDSKHAELMDKLHARLQKLGWPKDRELKWTKVSPAGLNFYEEAIDFFLTEPDIRFSAIAARKVAPPIPKKPDSPSDEWIDEHVDAAVDFLHDHDRRYYDLYFQMLRMAIAPVSKLPPDREDETPGRWRHRVFIDVKDTRGGPRIAELEKRLADPHYDYTGQHVVSSVSQVRSREVLFNQLADLLIGCVSHALRTEDADFTSPAKAALIKKLEKAVGFPLTEEGVHDVSKFVITHAEEVC